MQMGVPHVPTSRASPGAAVGASPTMPFPHEAPERACADSRYPRCALGIAAPWCVAGPVLEISPPQGDSLLLPLAALGSFQAPEPGARSREQLATPRHTSHLLVGPTHRDPRAAPPWGARGRCGSRRLWLHISQLPTGRTQLISEVPLRG